eukprot:gene13375-9202_t
MDIPGHYGGRRDDLPPSSLRKLVCANVLTGCPAVHTVLLAFVEFVVFDVGLVSPYLIFFIVSIWIFHLLNFQLWWHPMSTRAADQDGRRVSDALNLDEIERILASIPEAPPPPAPLPGAGGQAPQGDREPISAALSFSGPLTAAPTPDGADQPPSFTAHRKNRKPTVMAETSHSSVAENPPAADTVLSPILHHAPQLAVVEPKDGTANPIPTIMKHGSLQSGSCSVQDGNSHAMNSAQRVQGLRTGCLEVIFRESCRAPDGTPLDHAVMIPSLSIADLEQPEGLAIQSDNAVSKHECYGVQGATLEEQQALEKEDETPPISSSELPYGGHVISVKQWNPVCLQACILLIPLAFFIVVFVTQFNTIVTTSSKNVLTTGKLLATLSTYLVEEQAIAAYINGFVSRLDATPDQMAQFYVSLEAVRKKYTAAQQKVDDVVAKIEEEFGNHGSSLQKKFGETPISTFFNSRDLATIRVRAATSAANGDIMMRYENMIGYVLIFRGIFMFQEAIRTSSEMEQTKNVFATVALYIVKSLTLYFEKQGLGLSMPSPATESEAQYLQYVIGVTRVFERTFLFPSDPDVLHLLNDVASDNSNTLEVRLPEGVEDVILQMLSNTFKATGTDVSDLTRGEKMVDDVSVVSSNMAQLNDPLMQQVEKFRNTNDYVALLAVTISFALGSIGLIWHAVLLICFRYNRGAYNEVNETAVQMRASVIRMHDATMKMAHLQVNDMDTEMRLVMTKKSLIEEEERHLYIGNRTVRKLEPFLPLPMVKPPVGVPAKALLHNSLFVRPTLIRRRGIVGMRLNFSYLTTSSRDVGSAMAESMSRSNFSGLLKSGLSEVDQISALLSEVAEKRSAPMIRERNYFEDATLIMKFVCEVANVLLPNNKSGAYLSQCGDDAVLWINVCDRVRHPSLIAYIITACVMEFCERRNFEPPNIALCRGDAVMGNITSFTRGGAPAPREGEWTKKAIFDEQYDDGVTVTGIYEGKEREEEAWKDFVSATEGMPTKRRFKRWLRQLFGLKTYNDTDELRKDVDSTLEHRALKKTVNDDDSDDEFEVALPEELSKESLPKPEASCSTAFTIYGEVLHEMEVALDLARSHSQNIVANELFTKTLVRDRSMGTSVLESISRPVTTVSQQVDGEQHGHRKQGGLLNVSHGPFDMQRDAGRGRNMSSTAKEITTAILMRFVEYGVVNAPLDIIEARRRSLVVSVEEVLTAKDRRRRQKEEERHARLAQQEEAKNDTTEAPNGAADDEENRDDEVVEAEEAKAPIEVVESETDDDEPVKGFTPLNRLVDVNVSTTTVVDNHATTSKIQVDVHAFYTIILPKTEDVNASFHGSPTSFASGRIGRNAMNYNAMKPWAELMHKYAQLCYSAEESAVAMGSWDDSGAVLSEATAVEQQVRSFYDSHISSTFAKYSAPRIFDVVKALRLLSEHRKETPTGLRQLSPFSWVVEVLFFPLIVTISFKDIFFLFREQKLFIFLWSSPCLIVEAKVVYKICVIYIYCIFLLSHFCCCAVEAGSNTYSAFSFSLFELFFCCTLVTPF